MAIWLIIAFLGILFIISLVLYAMICVAAYLASRQNEYYKEALKSANMDEDGFIG